MEHPRISVIMGIYNCASTLREALDSLLAQTFQAFKVIMCDDGSVDDTYNIAKEYVDKFPEKFILIRNEKNLKLAATLNKCLELVDTEYVARMDGDDISLPTRFEKQIAFLEENPMFSHISCAMNLFDEDGIYSVAIRDVAIPGSKEFINGTPYFHAPTLFRFEALKKVGFYTSTPRVERVEDYYLWYKFHQNGLQGYNLNEPLYSMRNDKNAFSRRTVKDRIKSSKIKYDVLNGLHIKYAWLYSLRDLSKSLVPSFIVRLIKRTFN